MFEFPKIQKAMTSSSRFCDLYNPSLKEVEFVCGRSVGRSDYVTLNIYF